MREKKIKTIYDKKQERKHKGKKSLLIVYHSKIKLDDLELKCLQRENENVKILIK